MLPQSEPEAPARGGSRATAANRITPAAFAPPSARQFWLTCCALLLAALIIRIAMLDEYLRLNPIAHAPWSDGEVYWETAGEIAAGAWRPSTPFLSAPLYPYVAALIRALGGGLSVLYGLQIGIHLLTGLLIAHVSRLRFSGWAGVAALAVFLSLTEPAVSSLRVMGTTLQLLLVVLIWWRWAMLADRDIGVGAAWRETVLVGALIGILALAYPSALLLAPVFALWVWWRGRSAWTAVRGMVAIGMTCAAIAPPTLHNWRVSGEFILISAHGGITLRQGNGPVSQGIFTYVKDIDPDRRRMHESAATVFQTRNGRSGSWREIDAHFRGEAVGFWWAQPGAAAVLFGKKLFWLVSSMNYDDISPLPLEREIGVASRSWLAPVATPWLLGLAALGLVNRIRTRQRYAPELWLLILPMVTVLLFFYTPRYRMPAVPVLCGLAGLAVTRFSRLGVPMPLAGLVAAAPLGLTFLGSAVDFDDVARWRRPYQMQVVPALTEMGDLWLKRGDMERAAEAYARAVEIHPSYAPARRQIGVLALRRGATAEAERAFRVALATDAADLQTHRAFINLLIEQRRYAEIRDALRSCFENLQAQGNSSAAKIGLELAWFLATCPDEKVRNGREAVRLATAFTAKTSEVLPGCERVLAAAYAADGQFERAVMHAEAQLASVRPSGAPGEVAEAQDELALYRAGRPLVLEPEPVSED